MSDFLKLNLNLDRLQFGRGQRPGQAKSSLLGLAFDGQRIQGVLVKRTNGSVRLQHLATATLELNLLTDDPELVGREIRKHLDREGIHEKACAICIPLDWALTLHTAVPDLPAADRESFLNIEAERGFPFGQDTLSTLSSRCKAPNGSEFATLVAVPRENLTTLQKVLRAAQLRPVSFMLGMPSLQRADQDNNEGIAAIGVGENHVELQVVAGGGIAALRTLQGALEQESGKKKPFADVVARDLRITLGQLPSELRETVRRLRVYGSGVEMAQFAEELRARAKALGLTVESVQSYNADDFGIGIPADAAVSSVVSCAVQALLGQKPILEFLPPKVSAWRQVAARYSSGKLAWTGAAAAGVIFIIALAFLFQQWQLGRWRSQWQKIKPRVTELDKMQQQIRAYRPWFDDSFRSLSILRKLTEAFPEDSSVTASRLEIREPGVVSCSGTARDQKALFKVVDQLRSSKEVGSVEVEHIRGKQFTINMKWNGGGAQ